MHNGDFFVTLIISLLIIAVFFLILREVICWYWKINRSIALLESIDSKLSNILNQNNSSLHSSTSLDNYEGTLEDYLPVKGMTGEAFCFGCKKTGPISDFYHHKKTDTYYHKGCIPKKN